MNLRFVTVVKGEAVCPYDIIDNIEPEPQTTVMVMFAAKGFEVALYGFRHRLGTVADTEAVVFVSDDDSAGSSVPFLMIAGFVSGCSTVC